MPLDTNMVLVYLQNEIDYVLEKIEELDSSDKPQEKIERELKIYVTVVDHAKMLKRLIEEGFFNVRD